MKHQLNIILLLLLPLFSLGQSIELTGTVLDSIDQLGLPSAKVELIKDNSTVSITETDFDGNFVFQNLEKGTYNLKIQTVGYPTTTINELTLVDQLSTIKIELVSAIKFDPVKIEWEYFTIIDSNGTIRCVRKSD